MLEATDDEESEYRPEFSDCTCDHDPEGHEWGGGCRVEGCPCEGGWTE
jgi:hypothetical protein